jgi:putative glutamine amidotransferase
LELRSAFLSICNMHNRLKIGITDCGKYENYRRWIESEPGMQAFKLSLHGRNADEVKSCDGILFSGGEDLHPDLYGRPEYVTDYGLKEIDPDRDRFEYEVIERALKLKKPVLGICRGLQLINVFLGGSLVPDIPRVFHSTAHGKTDGVDQTHFIRVEAGTLLQQISKQELGLVNSAHHQSADRPAASLRISAFSEPAIVEAMEWKEPANKSWLLMVQWHPERMNDLSSPFSQSLKNAFLESSRIQKS